jgi:hypothetical protein
MPNKSDGRWPGVGAINQVLRVSLSRLIREVYNGTPGVGLAGNRRLTLLCGLTTGGLDPTTGGGGTMEDANRDVLGGQLTAEGNDCSSEASSWSTS